MRPPARRRPAASLPLDLALLKPGMRLAVGLSGGADSVALLRALAERSRELGLVLHAAHLHHGLRGEEADGDLEFCRELAARLEIPFHEARVDTAAEAKANPAAGKAAETLEEAARRLRYSWFRELLSKTPPHAVVPLDAVATAHTLDDQAETVLGKFLRGAWTEGLAGISPKLESAERGLVVRPLLSATRVQVEAYLRAIGQTWREDSTNHHLSFTRNRIRHELLPLLEGWNPRLREHLAQMAELARDEEAWWQVELARVGPQMILPGGPVRGGGRAAGSGLAPSLGIDVIRLAALAPALQRRLLRYAAEQLGAAPDFAALDFTGTEALRALAVTGRAGQKCELEGLHAERTPRELRLSAGSAVRPVSRADAELSASAGSRAGAQGRGPTSPAYSVTIPGEVDAPAFGLRLRIDAASTAPKAPGNEAAPTALPYSRTATLRNWAAGDRVTLRYSGGPRKVKEVLERMRVTGSARALWPVLELEGRIVWMQGVELEPEPGMVIRAGVVGVFSPIAVERSQES